LADLIHDFGSGMKCSFPAQRKGLTEWKAKIGDYVQDIAREALFSEWSFLRIEGECADRVMKIDFYCLAGYNVDLISKM
jgi:hypothetical protein